MLIDDLKERLKSLEPDIQTIKNFWINSKLEDQFCKLEAQSLQEDFWQHPNQAQISKELQALKNQREQYQSIINTQTEIPELLELFAEDEAELNKLSQEIKLLSRNVAKFKVNLLLDQPNDRSNCFFSINAGAGGTESQDWANMLYRMITRFCEREKFKFEIADYQGGEEAGIKSVTLYIKGKNAYGLLKGEAGIHRLVRISPFDSANRRHTSFAAVSVAPEMPEVKIEIDPKDLRIDTYRAGGAGGQHVNRTDSAVRITHIPSGLVAQSQSQRSQHQNKDTAMKMLMARLVQKQEDEQRAKDASVEKKKMEWGSQIRSYVLHPYKMVKDHRTGIESHQPDMILDGDIMKLIEGYLVWSH